MTDLVLGHDPHKNKIVISRKEQRNSLYVIGKSGSGKSTLLLNMIKQTMDQEVGMCLIDPHSALINQTIAIATPEQRKRIILIDITDEEYCCGLNLYECPNPQSKKAVNDTVERIMLLWDKLFHITTKEFPQISEYMRQAAHTIVVNPGYTMAEVYKLFRDKEFRNRLLANVQNQSVKEFWEDFENLPRFERDKEIAAVRRRLSEFMTDMVIPIVGQAEATIKMSEIMDARPGKILLVKLDRNQESVSSLIGSMLISLIRIAGFAREENQGKHFIVYSDEFSNYASSEYQTIVSELRKYAVCTVMSHQDRYILEQQVPELLRSTLGTNIVVFSLNAIDVEAVKGRFDATPEPEETGKRNKQTPVTDVIGALLSRGSNVDPVVNRFAIGRLKELETLAKEWEKDGYTSKREELHDINRLLYEAMISAAPEPPMMFLQNYMLVGRYAEQDKYYLTLWKAEEYTPDFIEALNKIEELSYGDLKKYFLYQIHEELDTIHRLKRDAACAAVFDVESWLPYNFDWTKKYKQLPQHAWFRIDVEPIANNSIPWEKALQGEVKDRIAFIEKEGSTWWYHPLDLEKAIRKRIEEWRPIFLTPLRELKEVAKALAIPTNHILADSGQEEITYKKGSHADKQKEIANMLSGLPNFTAYTRIGGDIQSCWSCGANPDPEEIYCTSCSKKLKQEYAINVTPPPMSPVDVKALANKIIQQNFRDAYLKKRSEIEKEIAARQQPPAPPTPQPQKPAAQPPIPAKRKAAIGKQCSKCQANNAATARFCNMCGTPL